MLTTKPHHIIVRKREATIQMHLKVKYLHTVWIWRWIYTNTEYETILFIRNHAFGIVSQRINIYVYVRTYVEDKHVWHTEHSTGIRSYVPHA